MSRQKIAPTLRHVLDTATFDDFKPTWVKADREFRALLAVARAARTVDHSDNCASWFGDECDCLSEKVTRALARLSGPRRKG